MSVTPVNAWATHTPLLAACAMTAKVGVVECGGGHYSTPLLKAVATVRGVPFVTIEEHPEWGAALKAAYAGWHEEIWIATARRRKWVDVTKTLDTILDFTPDMIFADCGAFRIAPLYARSWCLEWAKEHGVRLAVVHDSEPQNQRKYYFDKSFPTFKYRVDWTGDCYRLPGIPEDANIPWASCCSDTDDLEWLAEALGTKVITQ